MNNNLKQLKKLWYSKLKETGFNDIEHEDGSINSCLPRSKYSSDPLQKELITAYYNMAFAFLHNYNFASNLDKTIWEYHSEGVSIRNIKRLLHGVSIVKSKTYIGGRVKALRGLMKGMYLG